MALIDLGSINYIINGNYGNHTIALIQWAYEQRLQDVTVASIDTGWAADEWHARVQHGADFAKQCGFNVVCLQAKPTFQELMRDRQEFPTQQFKWCAGFLKGLTLLRFLDEIDPSCEAVIIMGKRRADSRANQNLSEFIEESEHYAERKIWYPLYNQNNESFHKLINNAGFPVLNHRSLECDPCVYSCNADFTRISPKSIQRTHVLEKELNKNMFAKPISSMVQSANQDEQTANIDINYAEVFDMGCGSPFACGE